MLKSPQITILAGPCMLESLEMALEVGQKMKTMCAKLGFEYVFKSSFDKANRTSATGVRGPGLEKGLQQLAQVKEKLGVPLVTDLHEAWQVPLVSEVVDILQIPAFLSNDPLLLPACAASQKIIHLKKGQHQSVEKLLAVAQSLRELGSKEVWICERGTAYGYQNLVVDFRNLNNMLNSPFRTVYDCTHSLMLPGAATGASSGLRQHIHPLAMAAGAVGVRTFFMEVHPNPSQALSDSATQMTPEQALHLLTDLLRLLPPAV